MATEIKDTPIIYGEDAEKLLKDIDENLKKDYIESFNRAKALYDSCNDKSNKLSIWSIMEKDTLELFGYIFIGMSIVLLLGVWKAIEIIILAGNYINILL
jgi:hypothetical protein